MDQGVSLHDRRPELRDDGLERRLPRGHVSVERLPTLVTAEQGKKGEGPKLEDEAPDDGDAPPSDVRRATTVTNEELRVFLALPDTRARIRKVVLARIRGQVSDVDVEDLAPREERAEVGAVGMSSVTLAKGQDAFRTVSNRSISR
jgi:hypothetical protein